MHIAIDGPAGAGKSTIARIVAARTGKIYVDTGAMYRAMALYFLEKQIPCTDQTRMENALPDVDISISYEDGEQHVMLNGSDVTDRLREEAVGNMASSISGNAEVREKLVDLQQKLAAKRPVVMDGRDIGTVVLPEAETKIYLTAAVSTRAKRRYRELLEKNGEAPSLATIEKDIEERDYRDMHREHSPLKKAADAVTVDTSDLNIEETVSRILAIAEERSGKGSV
jgi:cytidylate kinase